MRAGIVADLHSALSHLRARKSRLVKSESEFFFREVKENNSNPAALLFPPCLEALTHPSVGLWLSLYAFCSV